MSGTEILPARLHGILARDAPIGVIVRRGPADWYEIILWHTDTDKFELGQWFHGAIYPQVCDLSPDGTKFLYFATKYRIEDRENPKSLHKWTVISRPPYLTALAFWPIYDHRWHGGGIFIDNNTVVLGADAERAPEKGSLPSAFTVITSDDEVAADAYENRRLASGWSIIQEGIWQMGHFEPPEIYRKECVGSLYYLLRYNIYNHGPHTYALSNVSTGETIRLENTKWADFDQQGRIVFGQYGKLFAIPQASTFAQRGELADFNAHKIQHIVAPDWATSWAMIES